ncbi:hypothetical protein ACIQCF_33355 [Streptomyces sp. NPDC088353]|uniref:hypothetical protein n=1 Tax=Streptomyces sp. NPDC088353 TaxID=3365855 RepID=UPI0038246762
MTWQAELILVALCLAALVAWVVLDIVDERADATRPERIGQPVRAVPPALPAPLDADPYRARAARVGGRHRRPEEPS